MSTTISYKGNVISTFSNQSKTLTTSGKWVEDDIIVTSVESSSGNLTSHLISLTMADGTTANLNVNYNDSLFETMITSYIPQTYNNKDVEIGVLDGVEWFNLSGIPIGEELIDYSKGIYGYRVNTATGEEYESEATSVSDYTKINPQMVFTIVGYRWYASVFYDINKQYVSSISMSDGTQTEGEYATKQLSSSNIPADAAYIRINTLGGPESGHMSLIRTA